MTTQYAAQVTTDLEDNIREQERVRAELAALQEKLQDLLDDHTVLIAIRRTIAGEIPVPEAEQPPAQTPTRDIPETGPGKETASTPRSRRTGARVAAVTQSGETPGGLAQPTLGALVRDHLADGPAEPRSTAEITRGLAAAHPDRGIKATVVRNTIEGLVAKGHVQRLKQGSSVYYTLPATHPTHPTVPTVATTTTEPTESVVDTIPRQEDRSGETASSPR